MANDPDKTIINRPETGGQARITLKPTDPPTLPGGMNELSVEHGKSKVRMRGSDWLGVTILIIVCFAAFHTFYLREDIRNNLQVIALSIQQIEAIGREQTCLTALPESKREAEYYSPNSMCKRVAR